MPQRNLRHTATGWSTIRPLPRGSRSADARLSDHRYRHRFAIVALLALFASARCGRTGPVASPQAPSVLRIGVGPIGVEQLVENLTIDSLAKVDEDGRVTPLLAKELKVSPDGLSLSIKLRPNVRFHDGSLVTAPLVADNLRASLPQFSGPAYDDVASIEAPAVDELRIALHRPSQFLLESLEAQIQKRSAPGSTAKIGTGAFMPDDATVGEIRANAGYYLGAPLIGRIKITSYPSIRTAWAELLREKIDMVYEVGVDALESLQTATTVNVFSYTRHYQYIIVLNSKVHALRSRAVRRALNNAIDRSLLIREAMSGHGLPSSGPIWPKHWAAQGSLAAFRFDPRSAAAAVAEQKIQFTCLVASDAERVALAVKRQLQAVGVEMVLKEVDLGELNSAAARGDFDGILTSVISGPSIVRPYLWWSSKGPRNRGGYSNPAVDAALDRVRHALSDDEYRRGIVDFQQAIVADPPAVFLAWEQRARAVSKRFEVPSESGTDPLITLRLWKPAAGAQLNVD